MASLTLGLAYTAFAPQHHPYADLSRGTYTDHFSHMNGARLWWRVGANIWRKPVDENARPILSVQERAGLPADIRDSLPAGGAEVFSVPGEPAAKVLVSSWASVPRLYPPGDELIFTLPAWIYEHSTLSFSAMNRWLIALMLVFAHASLFFVWLEAFRYDPHDPEPVTPKVALLRTTLVMIAAIFVSEESIHFALEGFYDAIFLGPLLLSARFLRDRRPVAALVSYCLAAFLHFRAFFCAPLALLAAWQLWQAFADKTPWRKRDFFALALASLLGGASLYAFFLCLSTIVTMPAQNPVYIAGGKIDHPVTVFAFLAITAIASTTAFKGGARFEALALLWMTGMFLRLPGTYRWYLLAVAPIIASPFIEKSVRRPALVRVTQLGYAAFVTAAICHERINLEWMAKLF